MGVYGYLEIIAINIWSYPLKSRLEPVVIELSQGDRIVV